MPTAITPQSRPPRVLQTVSEADGAYGAVAAMAAKALPAYGYQVAVAASESVLEDLAKSARRAGTLRKLSIGLGRYPRPLTDLGSVWKLHRQFSRVDIVHAHGLHVGALCSLAMTGLPASARPVLVVTVPRLESGAAADVDHLAGKLIARRADVVLGATESIVERFSSHVAITERALLPATDTVKSLIPRRPRQEVRESLGIAEGTWMIASPARLVENPGLTSLIEAVRDSVRARPDRSSRLVLTGDGPVRGMLATELAAAGPSAPIRLADGDQAVDILSAADVVVAVDQLSGFDPDQIMQLTRPIVAITKGAARDYYGEAAHIVADDDPGAARKAIDSLLDDPARRGIAAIKARSRVLGSAAGHDVIAQLARVYQAALDAKKGGAGGGKGAVGAAAGKDAAESESV